VYCVTIYRNELVPQVIRGPARGCIRAEPSLGQVTAVRHIGQTRPYAIGAGKLGLAAARNCGKVPHSFYVPVWMLGIFWSRGAIPVFVASSPIATCLIFVYTPIHCTNGKRPQNTHCAMIDRN